MQQSTNGLRTKFILTVGTQLNAFNHMYNKTEECRSLRRGTAQNGFRIVAFLSTSTLMRSVLPLSFGLIL